MVEKVDDHILNNRIPLTNKIYQELYGNVRIGTFHMSDIFNIDNVKRLIGTKKIISSFKYMQKDTLIKMRGIQTKGAFYIK